MKTETSQQVSITVKVIIPMSSLNIVIGNIVGVVTDSVVIVTTVVNLWKTREKK